MLRVKGVNLIKIIVLVEILAVVAFVPPLLPDYYVWILRDVFMWVALAVSWDLFSGSTKYISLGSAAFFGIGLYFAAASVVLGLPLPIAVLFSGLVCFGLALALGLVTLRLRGIYFAIVTFSVSMVISNLITWWEATVTGTRGTFTLVFSTQVGYYTVLIASVLVLFFTALFRRSKFMLALKMIGESEEAAVHVGVNSSLYKILGFAISATLMGFMGGCSVTARFGYINTDIAFSPLYSFMPPVMALIGGIGTVYGPIIGATIIYLLQAYLLVTFTRYFLLILGSILIIIVMLMPNGILGIIREIRAKTFPGYMKEIFGKIGGARLFGHRRKAKR